MGTEWKSGTVLQHEQGELGFVLTLSHDGSRATIAFTGDRVALTYEIEELAPHIAGVVEIPHAHDPDTCEKCHVGYMKGYLDGTNATYQHVQGLMREVREEANR